MKFFLLSFLISVASFSSASAAGVWYGEYAYLYCNEDVAQAVRRGEYRSGSHHFEKLGSSENRITDGNCVTAEERNSKAPKWWNEREYLRCNPDAAYRVTQGQFRSGWQFFVLIGRFNGNAILCRDRSLPPGEDVPN